MQKPVKAEYQIIKSAFSFSASYLIRDQQFWLSQFLEKEVDYEWTNLPDSRRDDHHSVSGSVFERVKWRALPYAGVRGSLYFRLR
jgi:hypothetical protein